MINADEIIIMRLLKKMCSSFKKPFISWALLAIICSAWMLSLRAQHASTESPTEVGLTNLNHDETTPELALLMGDLQRLTHKLALSADAGNAALAGFYLHESMEQLHKIQSEAPEYERLPIALLIDRLAHPAYGLMQEAVNEKNKERMLAGLDGIIQSCNACHIATQHPFIRITRGTEINPFNQSFQP